MENTMAARTKKEGGQKGQFQPGQSGHPEGRPKGAKGHISKEFRDLTYEAFQELGGKCWLIHMAESKDPRKQIAILNLFSKLLPKDINIESDKPIPVMVIEEETDDEEKIPVGFEQPSKEKAHDKEAGNNPDTSDGNDTDGGKQG
jgi:hypothetical protein